MSQAYRLTERAEADVDAITDFVAADSIDAAVKVVLALEDALVLLASRPGIGHAREDLTDRQGDLELALGTMIDGIRSGTFQMAPVKPRDCQFCDFNRLCPAGRHRQIERKARDKRAKPLAAIREIE